MILAVSTWPVKAILSTSGMRDQGGAGRLAIAVEHVDDAVGEACFQGQLGQAHAGERRLLGQLHDDGVAAGQGRAPFPGQHQQREVPGNDLAHDADRLPQRVAQEVAADGHGAAFDLVGPAGVVAQGVDDALQVAAGVGDGLAAVERFQGGQLLGLLLDQVGQLEQQSAAVGGVHLLPGARFQRLARGLDRRIDVGLVGLGDLAKRLAGGRVDGREGLVRVAVHEFAADEERLVLDDRRLDGARSFRSCSGHNGLPHQ